MEELREPLNLIRNFVHILQEQHTYFDPSEVEEALGAIEEQVEVALETLDEVTPVEAPRQAQASAAETQPYGLSSREIQVLAYVAQGLADKQIAAELGISIFTVNKHVGGILAKMRAASRTEAGVRAVQEGLI